MYLYGKVPAFAKQYKYLLGEKMLGCCIESIVLIGRISDEQESGKRAWYAEQILVHMHALLTYARVAHELHQLGKKEAYFHLSKNIVEIIHQAESWKRFLYNRDLSQNRRNLSLCLHLWRM